jgi:threonyl-tRNA synthetase
VELSPARRISWGRRNRKEIDEGTLKIVLSELGMSYVINEGDGAFYGRR